MTWDIAIEEAFGPKATLDYGAGDYSDIISRASKEHGVDADLIKSVIKAESNFKPKAVSLVGAKGLMQIMDATAGDLGITDPLDPQQNIMGGTKYLAQKLKRYGGDKQKALAAYNAGSKNIDKAIKLYGDKWLENLGDITGEHSKETQGYLKKIQNDYKGGNGGMVRSESSDKLRKALGYKDFDPWTDALSESLPEPPVPESQELGMIRSAGRGLVHGVLGLGETTGTALEYFGHRLGDKAMSRVGKETSDFWKKKAEPFGPPADIANKNVWDNPEVLSNTSWWAYNVSEMLPAFAAMMVPAAGVEVAMLKIGTKLAPFSSAALERIFHLGRKIAVLGTGGLVGGGLEGSSTYKQVLESGGSEQEAARAGEFMTIGAGFLNAIGISKVLAKAGVGFKAKIIKTMGAGAWEGLTEGAEEPTEVLSKVLAAHIEGKPIPEDINQQLVDSLKDALTVAPIAGVTGMGGSVVFDIGMKKATQDPDKKKEIDDKISIQKKKAVKDIQDEILTEEMFPTEPEPSPKARGMMRGALETGPVEEAIEKSLQKDIDQYLDAGEQKAFMEGDILKTTEAKTTVDRAVKALKKAKKDAGKSGDWTHHNELQKDIQSARLPNVQYRKDALRKLWNEFGSGLKEPIELTKHYIPTEPGGADYAESVRRDEGQILKARDVKKERAEIGREDIPGQEFRKKTVETKEGIAPKEIDLTGNIIEVAGERLIKQQGKWYNPQGDEVSYSDIKQKLQESAPLPEKTEVALEGKEAEVKTSERRILKEQRGIKRVGTPEIRRAEQRNIASRKRVENLSAEEKKFVIPELRRMLKTQKKAALRQERIADTDPLTGLKNRRGFYKETAIREKEGRETIYTFIDLVGFKALNDDIGHDAGDNALKYIGKTMRDLGLENATRWGGDELMFVSYSVKAGNAAAQKLHDYFNNNPLRIKDKDGKQYDLKVMFRHGTGETIESADLKAESARATEPPEWKRGRAHPGLEEVFEKPTDADKPIYYYKEFEIKETGETVKLKIDAGRALEEVEGNILAFKALKDCLS